MLLVLYGILLVPGSVVAQSEEETSALHYRIVFTKGVSLVFMPNQDMPAFVLTIRTFAKDGTEEPQQTIILEDLKKDEVHTFTLSATGDQYFFQFQPVPAVWLILGDCIKVSERHLTCVTRKQFIPLVASPK